MKFNFIIFYCFIQNVNIHIHMHAFIGRSLFYGVKLKKKKKKWMMRVCWRSIRFGKTVSYGNCGGLVRYDGFYWIYVFVLCTSLNSLPPAPNQLVFILIVILLAYASIAHSVHSLDHVNFYKSNCFTFSCSCRCRS